MTATELRKFWHAAPFEPFNIVLAGSEKLHVPHPDFLSVSPSGRIAYVWKKGDDRTAVDVMLITAVETTRNGSKSRRSPNR
jgi:uncharacterized protein YndB with AHSA1/START domain